MIDLTPLDVRKKRGDFRKVFRGYDPEEVDTFLEVVAERFEALVSENRTLAERAERLQERVAAQDGREKAVQEALVTAQELREEMRQQARREADLVRREAEAEAERVVAEAERRVEERRDALDELERMRARFLKSFRRLLERELDAVEVEEGRSPLDDEALEISFSASEVRASLPEVHDERAEEAAEPGDEARSAGTRAEPGDEVEAAGADASVPDDEVEPAGVEPSVPDDEVEAAGVEPSVPDAEPGAAPAPLDIDELAPDDAEPEPSPRADAEADPSEPLWLLDEEEDAR